MVRGTGVGTSLMLIAVGAILALAIDYQLTGIDINTVGWILILVGVVGLVLSFLVLGGLTSAYDSGPSNVRYVEPRVEPRADTTTPHEHRRVETTDVVYEDDDGNHVERERRIRR